LVESLPSKQVVASSSLVSRSTGAKEKLMSDTHSTEKIIGSLVSVSGHTFDIRYDLFFTTERVIAVLIEHPADALHPPSLWKSVLLGDMLSGQMGKHEQRRTSQRKRRSLQGMTPDELAKAHPRNVTLRYDEIDSTELMSRFFQHQLRFQLSAPTKTGRVVGFNLSKKQVPEARRLLELASLSK
jgi:hypothetical protein